MRKVLAVSGAMLAVVLGFAILGWTLEQGEGGFGGGERGERGRFPRILSMLDSQRVRTYLSLADSQADRLRQILVDTQKSTIKTRAEMAVRGIELRELLRVDKTDHDAVMKKAQEISDLRTSLMKQNVEALLAAKSVLTPDQQKKIRNFIESRGAGEFGREGFMGRRGGWGRAPEAPNKPADPPIPPDEPPVQ